jgi:hypothetical protein
MKENSSNWPGAFKLFGSAKKATLVNLPTLLMIVIIGGVFNLLASFFTTSENNGVMITANVTTTIVSLYFSYALAFAYLSGARGKKISFNEIHESLKNNALNYVIFNILISLILAGSFLLFIIPLFIVWPRTSLWMYALIDGAENPIKKSWELTKGHIGKIYGIVGAQLLVLLLVFTIVGIPFVIYWFFMFATANALLYKHLNKA